MEESKYTPEEGYEIALGRIEEVERTGSTELDLSDLELNALSTEIWQLINLTSLDLSMNPLKSLPVEIGELVNLTSLDISNNILQDLPQ